MGWWSDIRATVVTVAIGIWSGGMTWALGMATLAGSAYTNRAQATAKKKAQAQLDQMHREMARQTILTNDPVGPRYLVYGKNVRLSGNITFRHIPDTAKTNYYIISSCTAHEVDWHQKVWVEDLLIDDWTASGNWWTPTSGTYKDLLYVIWKDIGGVADATLVSEISDKWTVNHTMDQIGYVIVKLIHTPEVYPAGMPNLTFECDGKQCYDPRLGYAAETENSALAILDFMRDSTYGWGFDDDDINLTGWEDEADTCDEAVGTETRYAINAVIPLNQTLGEITEQLLDTCAGILPFPGGVANLRVGKWRTPDATLPVFTKDDLRGPITYSPSRSKRDLYNQVKGLFMDPDSFVPASYPAITGATYVTADGETIPFDADLPFVNQPGQCQRIANIMLERNRREGTGVFPFSAKAMKLIPGDNFYFTYDRFGFDTKTFEVIDLNDDISSEGIITVSVIVNENDSNVFADPSEATYEASPTTNLPSAYDISDPSNLAVTEELRPVGDIVGNLVTLTWDAADSYFVQRYHISYKQSIDSDWISLAPALRTETRVEIWIDDAANYDFKIRSENQLGAYSSGATLLNQPILGKTAKPSDVASITASIADALINLTWPEVSDLDVKKYEVQYNKTASAWDAVGNGKLVVGDQDDRSLPALAYGTWRIMVKAKDTTGHYSDTEASTDLTVTRPANATVTKTVSDNGIMVSWNDCKETFPIKHYKLRETVSDTIIGYFNTTQTFIPAMTAATLNYEVTAIDVAGNESETPGTTGSFTISGPSQPRNDGSYVERSRVQIKISDCETDFDILNYEFRRGSTTQDVDDATVIGMQKATLKSYSEQEPGTRKYWFRSIDIANNKSDWTSIELTTLLPAGIAKLQIIESTYDYVGGYEGAVVENIGGVNSILLPVSDSQTFDEHFTDNSKSTMNDFGDTPFVQPGPTVEDNPFNPPFTNCWFTAVRAFTGGGSSFADMDYNLVPGCRIKLDFDKRIISAGAVEVIWFVPYVMLYGDLRDGGGSTTEIFHGDFDITVPDTFLVVNRIDALCYCKITGSDHLARISNVRLVISWPEKNIKGRVNLTSNPQTISVYDTMSVMEIIKTNFQGTAALTPNAYDYSNDGSNISYPLTFKLDLKNSAGAGSTGPGAIDYEIGGY